MKLKITYIFFLVAFLWPNLAHALESELVDGNKITVSRNDVINVFKFPSKIKDFRVISARNPKTEKETALIVLVKCKDEDSEIDKWYFQFHGFFGNSTGPVEFGVSPPQGSRISEIYYLYGDTFGFKLRYQPNDGDVRDWYYVTSCPTRVGKDYVGAYFIEMAQKMIEDHISTLLDASDIKD